MAPQGHRLQAPPNTGFFSLIPVCANAMDANARTPGTRYGMKRRSFDISASNLPDSLHPRNPCGANTLESHPNSLPPTWRRHSCLPRRDSSRRIGGPAPAGAFTPIFAPPRRLPTPSKVTRNSLPMWRRHSACRVETHLDALPDHAPAGAFTPIFAPPRGLPTLVFAASTLLSTLGGPRTGGRLHSHLFQHPYSVSPCSHRCHHLP